MDTIAMDNGALFQTGDPALKGIFSDSHDRRLSKGESLWRAGDDPSSVYLLKKGRVSMVIESAEGAASTVHFCTKAQSFCTAAAFTGRPLPCSAVAAVDTVVAAIPSAGFMKHFDGLPEFARKLLDQMAGQLCDAHCRLALSTAPVRNRLASLLGSLHRRYAGRDLPFTRQELADMSGTTVESAIRTLSQWEKSGVIESGRGCIHVRRPETLDEVIA